jgi:hypothetical protein
MARNNRGKKSPQHKSSRHTHTRKRPSNVVRYVDDTVYFPPTQYPSFSEESIQRQLGIPVMPEHANLSALHSEDIAPADWYTYAGGPAYYPSTLEQPEYVAEVGHHGATYYSPGREHFALHPETPEVVEVGGTTYYSPHQRNLDLLVPEEEEEEFRGYIEGYHHPQIEHQTRDWWALFGDTTGEMYVLDWVKVMRDEEAERMGSGGEEEGYLAPGKMSVGAQRALQAAMTRHMEGESGEVEEEWSPEKYFAPYRTPEVEACEVEREEEALGDRVVAWVMETESRGRDDWECQFCGVECFCRNLSD